MNQYCQYCAFCIEGDAYYCTVKERVLSESGIKRANRCGDYAESVLGSIISGKRYTPRKPRTKKQTNTLFEIERR